MSSFNTLRALVNMHGPRNVLDALSNICRDHATKASNNEHLRADWSDAGMLIFRTANRVAGNIPRTS